MAGYFYRPQGEGNVFTGVCLSTIGLIATRSLLGLVVARSARILLEFFLVNELFLTILGEHGRLFTLDYILLTLVQLIYKSNEFKSCQAPICIGEKQISKKNIFF